MRRLLAGLVLLAGGCAGPSEAPVGQPGTDWPAIATELEQRVERDQAMRAELMEAEEITPELVQRLTEVDEENTAWMKTLVAHHGWPTIQRVGPAGSGNAWLLVQHADQDVDFQEQCLELLRGAVAAGQAERKNLAYLEDRVAMHRGRPQRYGTQYVQKGSDLAPYELEDPARVDEWRAEAGLGTLAEYEIRLRMR